MLINHLFNNPELYQKINIKLINVWLLESTNNISVFAHLVFCAPSPFLKITGLDLVHHLQSQVYTE